MLNIVEADNIRTVLLKRRENVSDFCRIYDYDVFESVMVPPDHTSFEGVSQSQCAAKSVYMSSHKKWGEFRFHFDFKGKVKFQLSFRGKGHLLWFIWLLINTHDSFFFFFLYLLLFFDDFCFSSFCSGATLLPPWSPQTLLSAPTPSPPSHPLAFSPAKQWLALPGGPLEKLCCYNHVLHADIFPLC